MQSLEKKSAPPQTQWYDNDTHHNGSSFVCFHSIFQGSLGFLQTNNDISRLTLASTNVPSRCTKQNKISSSLLNFFAITRRPEMIYQLRLSPLRKHTFWGTVAKFQEIPPQLAERSVIGGISRLYLHYVKGKEVRGLMFHWKHLQMAGGPSRDASSRWRTARGLRAAIALDSSSFSLFQPNIYHEGKARRPDSSRN